MLVSDGDRREPLVEVSAAYPLAADACRSERLQFVRDLARKAGYSRTGVSPAADATDVRIRELPFTTPLVKAALAALDLASAARRAAICRQWPQRRRRGA